MKIQIQKPRMVADVSVSKYENVSAWLTAVVTILGLLVVLFLMIWLLTIFRFQQTEAVAITEFPGDPGEEALRAVLGHQGNLACVATQIGKRPFGETTRENRA